MGRGTVFLTALILTASFVGAQNPASLPNGIAFYDANGLGDSQAKGIPFAKLENFRVTFTLHTADGRTQTLMAGKMKKIFPISSAKGNLATAAEIQNFQREWTELGGLLEKYPASEKTLQPVVAAFQQSEQLLKQGMVRLNGQWVTKAQATEMMKPKGMTITDSTGRTYQGVKVSKVDDDGLLISHSGGMKKLKFENLPADLQKKYGFDPNASKKKPEPKPKPPATVATAPPVMKSKPKIKPVDPPVASVPAKAGKGPMILDPFAPEEKEDGGSSTFPTAAAPDPTFFVPGNERWEPKTLDDVADCTVLIEGDAGSGSGFICNIGNDSFVYTNAHVISGNTKLKIVDRNGYEYKDIDRTEVVDNFGGGDLLRFHLRNLRRKGLTLAPANYKVANDSGIAAVGNSHGQAVVRILKGKVKGIGPDRIEIDAEVVQGNSGGPIVEVDSLRVVGVTTLLYKGREDIWAKNTGFSKVRRFGLRANLVDEWKPVSSKNFILEGKAIEEMRRNVLLVRCLPYLDVDFGGVTYNRHEKVIGDYNVGDVMAEFSDHTLVKNVLILDRKLKQGDMTVGQALATYANFIRATGKGMVATREAQNFDSWSQFHREILDKSGVLELHEADEKALGEIVTRLRQAIN
ncbi:MAG: trypsin-like peptidase domain-containing protein [Verrucomicrobiales bacterium]|nr:trypsin-like peptidase domain-containing protein [Verrucomicrobiales bacterium]